MGVQDAILKLSQEYREKTSAVTTGNVREFVAGLDRQVPLVDGRKVTYVNLDNAATTPPFKPVLDCLAQFSQWYSSIHRGTGFKSILSTHVYERCREVVADFIGADLSYHTLIFVQNATHALNKLSIRACVPNNHVVLSTVMEHHSNLLPWRKLGCKAEYAGIRREDGSLDLSDLESKIRQNADHLCLVTVSGASNVTGALPPIRRIARSAHENGALIAVDATQLVPHRSFRMGAPDDPERIDFAAFSAHKMYAPFGSGVLVGPRKMFEEGAPDMVGGGTIEAVTMDEVIWKAPPERDEAGTPNLLGALALATAVNILKSIGMDNLAAHERELTRRLLTKLVRMKNLTLYGLKDPTLTQDRLGVIALNARGLQHAELAAILGYEWGIGVRNGCFCAQPYVRELLGISKQKMQTIIKKLAAGDHSTVPGIVRASLGVYNTADEVDYFAEALESIIAHGAKVKYVLDPRYMDYVPDTVGFNLDDYSPF